MSDVKTLADRIRHHGNAMRPGLYQTLLLAMADDWEAGGVVREILGDDAPSAAVVQLRLLGGLQRLVLSREAPELAMYYASLGGTASPEHAWAAVEPVLRAHIPELREALLLAPQTNEVGRSAALLIGLFDAVRRSGMSRVRLLEVGASAGLNLLVDHFHFSGTGWSYGPSTSPLQLTEVSEGVVEPIEFTVVSRRGCDLSPIDASSMDGRLRLTSFVWPDDLHRHERLRAALQVAVAHPVSVDAAPASSWLAAQLAQADPDVLTVVWHSITRQYWPLAEIQAVDAAVAQARTSMPIAQIAMESPVSAADGKVRLGYRPPELTVQLSIPGGGADSVPKLIATIGDHGIPVRMVGQATARRG